MVDWRPLKISSILSASLANPLRTQRLRAFPLRGLSTPRVSGDRLTGTPAHQTTFYNRPYGDIYMEVGEAFRRRGLGAFLVQELKRECYNLGAVPCARCNPTNVASRRTLQRAGFVPVAHILIGSIVSERLQQSPTNSNDK